MRHLITRLVFPVLACTLLCLQEPAAQETAYEKAKYGGEGIITSGPEVTGFEGSSAILEFETSIPAIDLLAGGDALRLCITEGSLVREVEAGWEEERKGFVDDRERCLIYGK